METGHIRHSLIIILLGNAKEKNIHTNQESFLNNLQPLLIGTIFVIAILMRPC